MDLQKRWNTVNKDLHTLHKHQPTPEQFASRDALQGLSCLFGVCRLKTTGSVLQITPDVNTFLCYVQKCYFCAKNHKYSTSPRRYMYWHILFIQIQHHLNPFAD
jgi:hypothetical protein